jgi:colicin import membrane protein
MGSMALHIGLVLVLSVNLLWWPTTTMIQSSAENEPEIIQATAVSEQKFDQEMKAVAAKEAAVKRKEELQKQEVAREKEAAKQKIIEQQKQIEEQKIAQEKLILEEQAEAERIEKAEKEKLKKLEEQKKLDAQKKVEAEQKAEAEKKQAEAQALEAQQKADAQKAEAERLRQEQLLADQQAVSAQQQAHITSELSRYQTLIKQKISSVWAVPLGATDNQTVRVLVRIAPDGTVLSAQITQSSGNAALDQSAYAAVLKASPLPVPTDFAVFNEMRELDIILTPQM